jgi:hypothetical protein
MWHAWERERCLQGFGGRPRNKLQDNIKMALMEIGIDGAKWIQLAHRLL